GSERHPHAELRLDARAEARRRDDGRSDSGRVSLQEHALDLDPALLRLVVALEGGVLPGEALGCGDVQRVAVPRGLAEAQERSDSHFYGAAARVLDPYRVRGLAQRLSLECEGAAGRGLDRPERGCVRRPALQAVDLQ